MRPQQVLGIVFNTLVGFLNSCQIRNGRRIHLAPIFPIDCRKSDCRQAALIYLFFLLILLLLLVVECFEKTTGD